MLLLKKKPCKEANEEIQIDFGGPIYNEKDDQRVYFLVSTDRFSKLPSAVIFDHANASRVQKIL